jgi:hypothetical protein
MAERTFDNRFRHDKRHFELAGTSLAAVGMSGARFEKATLDEEIGPEIVVMLTDSTPFAHELKRKPFALRLKSGVAQTSVGPILFLLWWIPPVTNRKPFALYEQILNPTHIGTLEVLRQIARQTHLHLILIGPGQALPDVYEFESTFGLEKLISISESACKEYFGMDFIAAKQEYDRTYLMELFCMSEPETEEQAEDEFLIAQSTRASEHTATVNANASLESTEYSRKNIDVPAADDVNDEEAWKRCAPMGPHSNRSPSITLERDTTFNLDPNAGDYLLCVRCANPWCKPPEFTIVDFCEFREGDRLLITNREENYPAPIEQLGKGGTSLWKVLPGDRLAWVGWRVYSAARKPTILALINCYHEGYVYGEPASPTLESVMSFGSPSTTEITPEIRSLWALGYDAAVALGLPRTWKPLGGLEAQ